MLKVESRLGAVHVGLLSQVINASLGTRKLEYIRYAFQKCRICLQETNIVQDVIQAVASMVIEPHHVSLFWITLAWKASSNLEKRVALQAMDLFHHSHIRKIPFNACQGVTFYKEGHCLQTKNQWSNRKPSNSRTKVKHCDGLKCRLRKVRQYLCVFPKNACLRVLRCLHQVIECVDAHINAGSIHHHKVLIRW